MTIGDSITQGFNNAALNVPGVGIVGSWRYWFWQNRGVLECPGGIDMVGEFNTLFNTTAQLPNVPAPTDQDHQARAGDSVNGYQRSRIVYHQAIERANPDVILMLLGTNDLFPSNQLGDSPETVRGDMIELIGQIRAHKPNVAIVLMGIQPRGTNSTWLARIVQTNVYYAGIADTMDTPGSPITYVDGYYGFNEAVDTFDHLHPSIAGQKKISARFLDGVNNHCAQQSPTTTTTTVPPTTTTSEPATTTTTEPCAP